MLRIYDVNFNRCSEGLRVLEETARFLLNDSELTKNLKHIRHQLAQCYAEIEPNLLSSRDSVNDVGIQSDLSSEYKRGDIAAIVSANARRAQESLRVLEEYSKLPEAASIDARTIEEMRFSLYQLERDLGSKLIRKDKADRITGIYLVLDYSFLKGRSEIEVAQQAIDGGVKIIQLRDKQRGKSEILKTAKGLRQLCTENNVLFIIDNNIDIALAADADGVHLGKDDLSVDEARKLMPIDKIIGRTATCVDEALLAESQGADYISVGAIYATQSKENAKLAGLEALEEIKRKIARPVVAIGGINLNNIQQVLDTKADAVAVISVILNRDDARTASSELVKCFEINQGE
ncbi:thiamine phosphate synthase [Chloroflexota bacterium]